MKHMPITRVKMQSFGRRVEFLLSRIPTDIFLHELFHILSRHNSELRRRLYQTISFSPCKNELILPESLRDYKITNPDAPLIDYFIKIAYRGDVYQAVPILYTDRDYTGNAFFYYLNTGLMAIEEVDGTHSPILQNNQPVIISYSYAGDFLRQVGRNTNYTIHPDEILADNFVLFVKRERDVPIPRILDEMGGVLSSFATSGISEQVWDSY